MRSPARISRRTLAASALLAAPAARSVSAFAQATPAATPSGGTRVITDKIGEVEVPVNPQRVVVLDGPQLDACLAVGVKPVGAVTGLGARIQPERRAGRGEEMREERFDIEAPCVGGVHVGGVRDGACDEGRRYGHLHSV